MARMSPRRRRHIRLSIRLGSLEEGLDLLLVNWCGRCPYDPLLHLTALEEHNCRDAHHLELRGEILVRVGVDLHELPLSCVLLREPLDDRLDEPARSAPIRVEVDQDGCV